jgi:hypothetical protein
VNPWPFIVGAYLLTLAATGVVTAWSWAAMRRAEAQAAELGREREA